MKLKLKEIWEKFEGKKRHIGGAIMLVSLGIQAFFPSILTPEQLKFIEYTGAFIATGGWLTVAVKEKIPDKILNKITSYKK